MEIQELMGRRIAEHRKINGLTQAELAELANVSRQTVSNIERGVVDATVSTVFALCRVLRVSPSNVFWEVGDPGVVDHIESDLLFAVAEKANAVITQQWLSDRERGVPIFTLNGGPVEMPRLSLSMVDGVLKALGQLGLYQFPQMVLALPYYREVMPCGHLPQDMVSDSEGTSYCGRCVEQEEQRRQLYAALAAAKESSRQGAEAQSGEVS